MNSKELKNIWEAYNQVYEQIGVPIPPGKTAKDVLEPLTKPHGGGKVIEPKKPTLQKAHYEPEGEQLSENPLASLDKLGRSAAQSVGGMVGKNQGQQTGIPGGRVVGGLLGRQKGGQMYDRATQPLRGRVPGFNKGGTVKKELSDEYIIGYLIDEGYADNDRSAFVIMSNMSGDWRGSITEQILSENALQDVGKNISNAAKMFRMMTGIDKMPQKPPSGPVNLNKIATQGSSKPQPQKQTFKIGTPPRPNATGQQNLMRTVRSNTQTRNPGVSLPTRSPHIAAAAAGLQSYNTGDGTLKAALRRGDYKPQQGPKNPDQGLSRAQSFDKAFKAARTSGQKEFTWNNKRYNTKMK